MSESFDNHVDLKLKLLQSVNDATLIWPVSEYDWFAYVALFTERCSEILPVQFSSLTQTGDAVP
jgi:hypothetical protein